jgi:hypothetical protein
MALYLELGGRFMQKYSGSCLCKKVVFEILGEPQRFFLCHCSRCRKETGSAHAANLFFKDAEFQWLAGKENVKTFRLPDTRFAKSFCVECGSALPTFKDGVALVPAGSLDCDINLSPNAHIFMGSKANWDKDFEFLPRMESFPKLNEA